MLTIPLRYTGERAIGRRWCFTTKEEPLAAEIFQIHELLFIRSSPKMQLKRWSHLLICHCIIVTEAGLTTVYNQKVQNFRKFTRYPR